MGSMSFTDSLPQGVSIDRLNELDKSFDHIAIFVGQTPAGCVARARLEQLGETGQPLTASDVQCAHRESEQMSVVELLRHFEESNAVLAVGGADIGRSIGFVTTSDLNRHPVRACIYPLVAEVEERLAQLIVAEHSDPWTIFGKLSDSRRPTVVGTWQIALRNRTDTGPLMGAYLTDLARIANSKGSTIKSRLSKEHVEQLSKIADNLRHDVMHPVRPLGGVEDDASISSVREQVEFLTSFLARLDELDQPQVGCNTDAKAPAS